MSLLGMVRAALVWILHSVLITIAAAAVPVVVMVLLRMRTHAVAFSLGDWLPWWGLAAGCLIVVLSVYAAHRALALAERTGRATPVSLNRVRTLTLVATEAGVLDPTKAPAWYQAPGMGDRPLVVDAMRHRYAVVPPPSSLALADTGAAFQEAEIARLAARDVRSGAAAATPALFVTAWWLRVWIDLASWLVAVWRPSSKTAISIRVYLGVFIVLVPLVWVAIALAYLATLASIWLVGPRRARAFAEACGVRSGRPVEVTVLADEDDPRVGFEKKDSIAPLVVRKAPAAPPSDQTSWRDGRWGMPLALAAAFGPVGGWWQFVLVLPISVAVSEMATNHARQPGRGVLSDLGIVGLVAGFALVVAIAYPRAKLRRDEHRHEAIEQRLIAAAGPQDDAPVVRARFEAEAGPQMSRLTRLINLWPVMLLGGLFALLLGRVMGWIVHSASGASASETAALFVTWATLGVTFVFCVWVALFPRRPDSYLERTIRGGS